MKWTDEKVAELRELVKTLKSGKIAEKLGCTIHAVDAKCQQLKISRMAKYGKGPEVVPEKQREIIKFEPKVWERPPPIYSNRNFRQELLDKYA